MGTEKMLKAFIHQHELTLFDKANLEVGNCSVCRQEISDQQHYYRCNHNECYRFKIHKHPCSEIPEFINHPFHPHHTLFFRPQQNPTIYCDACGASFYNFAYQCSQCSFSLHVNCAFLMPATTERQQQQKKKIPQQTINHPHPLILCDKSEKFCYTCSCCNLAIEDRHDDDDDDSVVYVCLQCKGLLHKSCAELPWEIIEHPFHPSHPLVLLTRLPDSDFHELRCMACNQYLNGFKYSCSNKCAFALDIICASLRATKNKELGQEEDQYQIIRQFKHSHPLILCSSNNNNKQNFANPRCYGCKLPFSLLDSIYFCPECNVLLHKSCADLPQEINNHLHHPLHTLALRYHRSRIQFRACKVCWCDCDTFFYECSQCKWIMDVRCAFLSKPTAMMSVIHSHPLAFFNKPNHLLRCNDCHMFCDSPFFRCVPCQFNLHVRCIPKSPPTIKSRHCHRLTLTDSPIKDHPDEDENAEFYCDACEERRELNQRTYYCKECHYVAHPHCVVSEIKQVLEEEYERHASADKVKETFAPTLKEFLDSFEEPEYKEVQALFEACRLDIALGSGEVFQYLDEESTQIIKNLASKSEVKKMPWENWDSTLKVIKMGDYMVLKNMVPILEALFSKYGDFSSRSSLISTKAKMLCMMVVCDVVQSMCSTKVIDITANQFFTWFCTFLFAQYAGFETQFGFDQVKRVMRAQFDHQASSRAQCELDKEISKLKMRIRTLEVELKKQRKLRVSEEQMASKGLL